MKRWSTSLVIRETQIKTTKHHLGNLLSDRQEITNNGADMEKKEPFFMWIKIVTATVENSLEGPNFFFKLRFFVNHQFHLEYIEQKHTLTWKDLYHSVHSIICNNQVMEENSTNGWMSEELIYTYKSRE